MRALARHHAHATHRILAIAVAAIVIAANASQGAYFSQSWGWVALAFLVPTTVLLIMERVSTPGRMRAALLVLLGAYASWIALSAIWSISAPATIRELERMLVYLSVSFAVALVLRRGDVAGVLAGACAGATAISAYALATRTFPDRFHRYDDPIDAFRLAQPLGYWNALGLLACLGVILALGFAVHAKTCRSAAIAAAAMPTLATTLYLTFSRGGWGALGVGLVATIVLDARRFRYVCASTVLALPTIACIAFAAHQSALTTENSPVAESTAQGHRLVLVVLIATVASSVAAVGAQLVARRVSFSRRTLRLANVSLAALAIVALVGLLSAIGGPRTAVQRLHRGFDSDPVAAADQNERLFSISSNGRSELFRVAWDAGRRHPVVGNGSGTYEYIWYKHRPSGIVVRDAHSAYLEAFAEVGVIGLGLFLAALVVLVLGGVRARRTRYAASGTAALIAWAAAAALDWHWEMVGVTLVALLAGGTSTTRGQPVMRTRLPGSDGARVETSSCVARGDATSTPMATSAAADGDDAEEREARIRKRLRPALRLQRRSCRSLSRKPARP